MLIVLASIAKSSLRILRLGQRALLLSYRQPRRALLMLRMANWLVILSILMRFLSLPRALEKISPTARRKTGNQIDDDSELASAIDGLLEMEIFVFRPVCWKRAAILHRYLALRGVENQINFGLRKETDGRVSGHAWVEVNGHPILETTAPNYAVTYAFPSTETVELDLNLLT